jgi:hypothetical protein
MVSFFKKLKDLFLNVGRGITGNIGRSVISTAANTLFPGAGAVVNKGMEMANNLLNGNNPLVQFN